MARIFLGMYDLSSYFWGVQNNMNIRGNARVSQAHTSANKVQPNLNAFRKFLRLENSAWDSLGVNFWSRDLFPPFDHPRHLKFGVPESPE